MLEVRIFRFDAKHDVLSYFKPYFFDNCDFLDLENLLENIKQNDPYFEFQSEQFVKINGVVTSLKTPMHRILSKFGTSLKIEPLSQKRAIKDLIIDDSDFWAKFQPFSKFCSKDDKAFYGKLKPYFYAGFMSEFEPNFIGFSAIIFAKFLCQKHEAKKDEILAILDDKKFGVWIASRIDNFIFDEASELNLALLYAKENLKEPFKIQPSLKIQDEICKNSNFQYNLDGFIVATYGQNLANFKSLKANFLTLESKNLPCGFDLLGLNDELAYKLASTILFEAFDSGADFLLVSDEKAFYMFDTLCEKLQKFQGRELSKFYILRQSELALILSGNNPPSLKEHKLKVWLVD